VHTATGDACVFLSSLTSNLILCVYLFAFALSTAHHASKYSKGGGFDVLCIFLLLNIFLSLFFFLYLIAMTNEKKNTAGSSFCYFVELLFLVFSGGVALLAWALERDASSLSK
jgi:hypothetical protein